MAIDLSDLKTIINNINADVRNELPELDPTKPASSIKAITQTLGARSFDNRQSIGQAIQQSFPQTNTEEFLEIWAGIAGLSRNAATIATGFVTATGMLGTNIPSGSQLSSETNIVLESQITVTISNILTSITSLTRVGNVVTVVCGADHKLASGITADILGAIESEYNGSFVVTVINTTTFTYFIITTPATPATGIITVDFDGAVVELATIETGNDQNIGAGSSVNFDVPVAGVDTKTIVRPDGIDGGVDAETDDDLRIRILEKFASILALFNSAFIITTAKAVAGVTRVFIKEITPDIGDTEVYFMRDNDDNPIPSGIDLANVNDILQEIRPANMQESDFAIIAPIGVMIDITLSSIVPDTATMRSNIENVMVEFFTDQVNFEEDILIDRIKTALFSAQDVETGQFLASFTLDVPATDVTISTGEIGTLGTVTIN